MARKKRRVFFSFHHQRDSWRVNQVRNSWVTRYDENIFLDAAAFEEVQRKGTLAVCNWIDRQLEGTSVTVVLIGRETAKRPYVLYEIEQSFNRGNGLLGIYIHDLKDRSGDFDFFRGDNPFDRFIWEKHVNKIRLTQNGGGIFDYSLAEAVKTYSWQDDDGYNNIADWIEAAAADVGR